MTRSIAISSGHGKYISGANDIIKEHDEAVRVVDKVSALISDGGLDVVSFEDTTSHDQQTNLEKIVDWHNSQDRDLDVSIHFNSNGHTSGPLGTECYYYSEAELAGKVASNVSTASGLKNRGGKQNTGLYFLKHTNKPAILVEICFVTSETDVDLYRSNFDAICLAVAETICGQTLAPPGPQPPEPTPDVATVTMTLASNKPVHVSIVAGTNVTLVGTTPVPPMPPAGELPPMFTSAQQEAICDIATNSAIARYSWRDRGTAPTGYVQGMAIAFAQAYVRYADMDDPIALEMGKANTGDDDIDALSWYNSNFVSLGLRNDRQSIDTLRHLFVLLMGLGMRESSGKHCCGRDQSASNTDSNTCEAGLFQTSWNAHACSEYFVDLFEQYEIESTQGYMSIFAQGVSCSSADWECYGSGDGYQFQKKCKYDPTFAVESCAITLRNLRQHYGPINRKEAELRIEADELFKQVQQYLESVV
jgi:N-acetylmuramoyl-L-alanine amidase